MTKTVCDFCGKEINPIRRAIKCDVKISKNGRIFDVCDDCTESLNEWMESKKQKRGNMESNVAPYLIGATTNIKALEQEQTDTWSIKDIADTLAKHGLIVEQEPILDKIRAEIIEEKGCAYADFERYKVEYLGQGCQDVYDSPPFDDFRYGMERCLEIIDKYKAESEDNE